MLQRSVVVSLVVRRTLQVTRNVRWQQRKCWGSSSSGAESGGPGGGSSSCPEKVDVLVIGGGVMGSSTAYWLKERAGKDLTVAVVEKDTTYSRCSTVLSVGGLRQQFSLPENVLLSMYAAEFLGDLKKRFGPEADVSFRPHGYLVLAAEEGAQQIVDNYNMQKELGAVGQLLDKEQLKKRFPWMNVSDLVLGCLGLDKEGWFDPWAFLSLFKSEAVNLGAKYICGDVVGLKLQKLESGETQEAVIKLPNGELRTIQSANCVLAAGAESGAIARLAGIGGGEGVLSVPLPVERRKRYVYRFECQGREPPEYGTPLTIDSSGAYFRRDAVSASFICGASPNPEDEPADTATLDVDFAFFDDKVWPALANRTPAFNAIKVKSAWGGFYEFNCFDENGVVGPHPLYRNLLFATGFSGHGIQHAPAVGRAMAELLLDGRFKTIDLTRLGFDRLVSNKPLCEIGCY